MSQTLTRTVLCICILVSQSIQGNLARTFFPAMLFAYLVFKKAGRDCISRAMCCITYLCLYRCICVFILYLCNVCVFHSLYAFESLKVTIHRMASDTLSTLSKSIFCGLHKTLAPAQSIYISKEWTETIFHILFTFLWTKNVNSFLALLSFVRFSVQYLLTGSHFQKGRH